MNLARIRCPECSATVDEDPSPTGPSVLLSCPQCGWRAATTKQDSASFDPQRYTVFVSSAMTARDLAVKLAVALGRHARDLLPVAAGRSPVAPSVDALQVLHLAGLLAAHGIAVHTAPPFPWAMPAVASAV